MALIKKILLGLGALILLTVAVGAYWANANNVLTKVNLFDPETRVSNFRNIENIYDTLPIGKAFKASVLPYGTQIKLPETYTLRGETLKTDMYLKQTATTGLLVMQDGKIMFEDYYLGTTDKTRLVSMSVAKSVVSALIGIALEEGLISSVQDRVTKYLPYLANSGYRDATLEHVLQMSSGVFFQEIYSDPYSHINEMVASSAIWGEPIADYPAQLVSEHAPGTGFNYASVETQVLGLILEKVTGVPLTEYLEEKLWIPLGMESVASWVVDTEDGDGSVFAFCCINAVVRDYARFGQLYLNEGNWNGEQLVPREWVLKSTRADKSYSSMKDHYASEDWEFGYQYQWWMPKTEEDEYMAIGVWGQYIYINPTSGTVIVKTSVDPGHGSGDLEALYVFRAIDKRLAQLKETSQSR